MTKSFVGWPPFPEAAEKSTRDEQLRANVHRATHTIRGKRDVLVNERPDWQQLRDSAAAVKDTVLHHLDSYLIQLERTVTQAGGVVHWATDAAEACLTVTELVRRTGERQIVKAKSMLTEEIGLDEALAAAGIDARETDLAEIILQLGDDLPSHIVVPSMHLNRGQIRDIFVREMGKHGRPAPEGLSDDPGELADAARLHLREKFLTARVGITGANFLVAETGTVVMVESEGNGRMCLTLPETLISVVGIEKVIPTWRDLEVFLQLLARSSTGERMSPYVSSWTGVTDRDGPRAFHLVLVDNGRSRALADHLGREALRCIRCGACMNICPVYERTGGQTYGSVYPGPIGAILNPLLKGADDPQTASLPYASSLCGACNEVCPVRIDIVGNLLELRHDIAEGEAKVKHRAEKAALDAMESVMYHPQLWAAAVRAAGIAGVVAPKKHLPPPLSGWTDSRVVPEVPKESFRGWWKRTSGGFHADGGSR
ncbi:iron-sulfur cluster-binding protein [Nocardia sp. 2]|uniref:Iron-sulfur cluster-binding protein n=1 Tax=Nocardia acididurans TaxID=2802282 RepID=A0ABS1M344_9NOCA|nr:LutB/LldF family L-lactate oxidation iron-sulfur protein [Nocardia acididurans]MBL1073553.1 iron-sulfur cluster-binding protein [Nocardia acididurans]